MLGSVKKRLRATDKGAVSLEFVGMFVIFLLLLITALQAMLAMFSLSQANSAARNAARSEVLAEGSGPYAAQAAVSPGLRDAGVNTQCKGTRSTDGAITCKVTISVPILNAHTPAWVPTIKVSRSATQPYTE